MSQFPDNLRLYPKTATRNLSFKTSLDSSKKISDATDDKGSSEEDLDDESSYRKATVSDIAKPVPQRRKQELWVAERKHTKLSSWWCLHCSSWKNRKAKSTNS